MQGHRGTALERSTRLGCFHCAASKERIEHIHRNHGHNHRHTAGLLPLGTPGKHTWEHHHARPLTSPPTPTSASKWCAGKSTKHVLPAHQLGTCTPSAHMYTHLSALAHTRKFTHAYMHEHSIHLNVHTRVPTHACLHTYTQHTMTQRAHVYTRCMQLRECAGHLFSHGRLLHTAQAHERHHQHPCQCAVQGLLLHRCAHVLLQSGGACVCAYACKVCVREHVCTCVCLCVLPYYLCYTRAQCLVLSHWCVLPYYLCYTQAQCLVLSCWCVLCVCFWALRFAQTYCVPMCGGLVCMEKCLALYSNIAIFCAMFQATCARTPTCN